MNSHFYLKTLTIQNFATFKNQVIQFRPGFNVIIGETGSGKSLVLEAMQILLGGRADKKIVRKDTEYSLLEATFHCVDEVICKFLLSEGFPVEGDEVIIKRIISKNGQSKTYINHLNCSLHFVSMFSRRYIDMVGQFENQKLLSENYQLHLLDCFASNNSLVKKYSEKYEEYKSSKNHLEDLTQSKANREQRLDYINYQIHEIEKLNPSTVDEENLLNKKNILLSLEKNKKFFSHIQDIIEGTDAQAGFKEQLLRIISLTQKMGDSFQTGQDILLNMDNLLLEFQNLISNNDLDSIDQEDLEFILDRLDRYQTCKRKFGGSTEAILANLEKFKLEKLGLDQDNLSLEDLLNNIESIKIELKEIAGDLHNSRSKASKLMSKVMTQNIQNLKMNGATIQIRLDKTEEFGEKGVSKVSFHAETNPGEGFYKIKDIASGGELSRILLSLRQILSFKDSISIFLFDEIDTGIGGETAVAIGNALCQVATHGQVLAITHLPQIAQFADKLIVVQKGILNDETESRTESFVREISGKLIHKEVKLMARL